MNNFELEITQSGLNTIKFNGIYLHSKYDPQKESEKIIAHFFENNKKSEVIFVLGLGLSYHIKSLRKYYPSAHIIVIEKNIILFKINNNIHFENISNLYNHIFYDLSNLSNFIYDDIDRIKVRNFAIFEHLPSIALDTSFYSKAKETITITIKSRIQNIITDLYFGRRWINNIINNSRYFQNSYSIKELQKKYSCPVVITASGPSLTKSIQSLKENQNKAIIISPIQSFRILYENNIIPDIIVSIDGGFYNKIFFNYIPEELLNKTLFIFSLSFYPLVKHLKKLNKCFINLNLPLEKQILLTSSNCTSFPMEGTVSLLCLRIAEFITTGTILFVGFDLAYTNGLIHYKGNPNDEKNFYFQTKFITHESNNIKTLYSNTIYVEGNLSNKIITSKPLQSFMNWANECISDTRQPIINCSEGGAKLKGIKSTKFSDFWNEFDYKIINKPISISDNHIEIDENKLKSFINELLRFYSNLIILITNDFSYKSIDNYLNSYSKDIIDIFYLHLGRYMTLIDKISSDNNQLKDILLNECNYFINKLSNYLSNYLLSN